MSWVDVPDDSDFPMENLPLGVFSTPSTGRRVGIARARDAIGGRFALQVGRHARGVQRR